MVPSLVPDYGDTEMVRQGIGLYNRPVLLHGATVAAGAADVTGVGLFLKRPREDASVVRSALLVVLLKTADAKTIERLAELVALPINPGGQVSAQVAARSPGLRRVGQGHVDSNVEFVAGPTKLRWNRDLI